MQRLHQTEMTIGELRRKTDYYASHTCTRERRFDSNQARTRDALHAASGWLEFFSAFWSESFDRLEETLDQGGREPNARLKR